MRWPPRRRPADCPLLAEPLLAEQLSSWVALLDELDRQLVRSRAGFGLGTLTSGIWTIEEICAGIGPVGPLPESLVPRAQAILEDYTVELPRIQATKRLVGEHLEILHSIRGTGDAHPVYLDQVG